MTKKVESGSIEDGVRQAFQHLGITKTIEAIYQQSGQRKSQSLLRKYSDPDDPKHHITLRDSIAIDAAFVAEGMPPPFQRIASHLLDVWSPRDSAPASRLGIVHLTLSIEAAAGLVAEAVLVAETLRSIGANNGRNSRPEDHADILKRLQELDQVSSMLRRAVADAARVDGDSARTRADVARTRQDETGRADRVSGEA